jgi:hypothetical protein
MAEWNLLTDLTGDRPFVVTAVRLEGPEGAGVTSRVSSNCRLWPACVTRIKSS